MKNAWITVGGVFIILLVGSVWYANSVGEEYDVGVDPEKVYVKGNPDAKVTLVEYSDFQCPACASWYPIVKDIVSDFEDDIRFEYKHLPLPAHPLAVPAAQAAEAAGQQDKFFEYHDLIFENQNKWSNSQNPNQLFIEYAEDLDLDIEQFTRHMKSPLLADKIEADFLEARTLEVEATPTFFLNGEKVVFSAGMSANDSVEYLRESIAEAVGTTTVQEIELPSSSEVEVDSE